MRLVPATGLTALNNALRLMVDLRRLVVDAGAPVEHALELAPDAAAVVAQPDQDVSRQRRKGCPDLVRAHSGRWCSSRTRPEALSRPYAARSINVGHTNNLTIVDSFVGGTVGAYEAPVRLRAETRSTMPSFERSSGSTSNPAARKYSNGSRRR